MFLQRRPPPACPGWGGRNSGVRAGEETGEIAFGGEDGVRVVWGSSDPQWFKDKLARLEEVRADLKSKSMRGQYVNLRGVPQSGESSLGNRKVVGRVVVRPWVEPKRIPDSN